MISVSSPASQAAETNWQKAQTVNSSWGIETAKRERLTASRSLTKWGPDQMKLIAITICCCAGALSGQAGARQVSGISVPATATVGDKELALNGAGVRKEKALFKVYVVALYLEQPTSDARAAITSDQEKHVVLSMLRSVSRAQFVEALETAILRNSRAVMPILRERLDLLQKALPPLEKGNVLTFTYLPGSGTVLRGQGQELTIPGKDFADALLSVWLGSEPVSGDLKRQLLAG